ncbi:MAG: hypothetical protein CW716_11175, partial [Candidatus Bathyarchaeum sp.]
MTKQVRDVLKKIGLSEREIEIYIFLSKKGPQKGTDITKHFKMHRGQVYRILKGLERKSFIEATLERPKRFIAVPLKGVIDSFIKSKKEEVSYIEQTKEQLLSDWKKIKPAKLVSPIEKLSVIEGKKKIFNKISQMISEAKRSFSLALPVFDLFGVEHYGVFDSILHGQDRSQIQVRILTQLSSQNSETLKHLHLRLKPFVNIRARNPSLGFPKFSRMLIRDEEEILLFISEGGNQSPLDKNVTCLVTNCKSIIQSFLGVFEELWQDSVKIKHLIAEIETGKISPKTRLIKSPKSAQEYYHKVLNSVKEDVLLITSSKGLIELSKNREQLENWTDKDVTIRIMAPIVNENLEATQQLLKFAEVRHIPAGYFETSIVDGQHLFQFKRHFTQENKADTQSFFDNTFYTSDSEYIQKTRNLLHNMWKKTHTPPSQGLRSITRPSSTTETPIVHTSILERRAAVTNVKYPHSRTITRKDVLDKIKKEKQLVAEEKEQDSKTMRFFGHVAWAIIHPPESLSLPEMIFGIYQMDKDSFCGRQNYMQIEMLQDLPEGKH